MFSTKFLVLAALFVAGVQAQSSTTGSAATPTSTSQIPPCVLQCVQQAAENGGSCTSFTDPCVCTDTKFQQTAAQCLTNKCSAADQQVAKQLEQALCGATSASSSASASGTATHSGSATSSAASHSGSVVASSGSAASHSGSASGSGSASASGASGSATRSAGFKVSFGQGSLIALGVTVAGAVVGGMMV